MARRILPVLAAAVWLAGLVALGLVLTGQPAPPRLMQVEGVDDWREAQAFRLGCQFAAGVQVVLPDEAWSLCFDAEGAPELVRYAFAADRIERRWPLPEALRPRLWPPPDSDTPADARPWLAVEAVTRAPTGELALVVTRWQGDDQTVALLEAAPTGGVTLVTTLDAPPLLVRGLAPLVDGGYELVLADGRLVSVDAEGAVTTRPLPDFPHDRDTAALEWARREAEVWRFLYSLETKPAEAGRPGFREVRLADPDSDAVLQPVVGTLQTTEAWPYGDFLAFHDGGAINSYLMASRRFDGRRLRPFPRPDGVGPDDASWVSTARQLLQLEGVDLTWLHPWQRLGTSGAAALRLPQGWLVVAGDGDGGLAVGPRPDLLEPLATRRWRLFAPLVAPASAGGWWLADAHGRYARLAPLGRGWILADAPDAAERLTRALEGRLLQATSYSSGAGSGPDGLLEHAHWWALGRRLVLPVYLAFPLAWVLLFLLARRLRRPERRGRWLAGPAWLLQVGAAAYLASAAVLVPSAITVLRHL